ncbi:hypothetical protein [uncultured Mailhella sp.]|uniref:hypothetical protein n=1 Tax=uncultured Mailhella sp. TaxID=1981031 RepID=UPI00320B4A10
MSRGLYQLSYGSSSGKYAPILPIWQEKNCVFSEMFRNDAQGEPLSAACLLIRHRFSGELAIPSMFAKMAAFRTTRTGSPPFKGSLIIPLPGLKNIKKRQSLQALPFRKAAFPA